MGRAARHLAAGALVVAVVVGSAPSGGAASAVEVGWWTAAPVAIAADAPPDALVVQGGTPAAISYGAVRYTLAPAESPESLTVALADGGVSTPASTLRLCPLTAPFTPAQGGPMADAPEYDCATSVESAPSSDGATYEFDVATLVGDGLLAVAVLPTAPTDRVVLSSPTVGSLTTDAGSVASTGVPTTPPRDAAVGGGSATAAAPAAPATSSSGSGSGSAAAPRPRPAGAPAGAATPAAAPVPGPAAAPAAGPSAATASAAQEGSSGGASWLPPVAFGGLAALAAALWLGRRADEDVVRGLLDKGVLAP